MQLGIQIDEQFQEQLSREWLQHILEHALSTQSPNTDVEMGLVITGDESVRELNRVYRGIDETTDVLSFALAEASADDSAPAFVTPPDGLSHLGEVIISYPRAAMQAQENNHSIDDEMALLVVHGTLHLLGYDHDEPVAEQEMRALEQKILSGISRPAALRKAAQP